MIDRRSLIRLSVAGSAAGIIAPQAVLAAGDKLNPFQAPWAGHFYYTKDAPGRWST